MLTSSFRPQCSRAIHNNLRVERLEDRSSPSGLDFLGFENGLLTEFLSTRSASAGDLSLAGGIRADQKAFADVPSTAFTPVFRATDRLAPAETSFQTNWIGPVGTILVQVAFLGSMPAESSADRIGNDEDPQILGGGGAPTILNFTCSSLSGSTYALEGDVEGEGVLGQTVTFGGLPTLDGPPPMTTTVILGNFGTYRFRLEVNLGPGDHGLATAVTQNVDGISSNVATYYV